VIEPDDRAGPRSLRVEPLWGTAITVDVRDHIAPELLDDVFAWFERVDELFSTWRADSQVNRLARGNLRWTDVDPEVRAVLDLCDRMTDLSRGAFDAYVGADPRVPPQEGRGPIDPSALVKGWALDRAAEQLRAGGIDSFAISAGGDIVIGGSPSGRSGWRIGIQHPWQRDKVAEVVEVSDLGIATSGRYERGNHVLDPRTARPATAVMSVTVIADDLAFADGCATAALVLGDGAARWLTDEADVAGMVIDNHGTVTVNEAFACLRSKGERPRCP
jgi:thiamine biosynthesis lipoprotein